MGMRTIGFLLALIAVFSLTASAQKKAPATGLAAKRIQQCLGDEGKIAIREEIPKYRIPFLEIQTESVLVVEHGLVVPETKTVVKTIIFFSRSGDFLRAESVSKMKEDPWRGSIKEVEKGWRNTGQSITGIPEGVDFDLQSFWKKLCKQYAMNEATEFNLSLVEYSHTGLVKKPSPALVLNVWGLNDPLGISARLSGYEISDIVKNRVCAIFDIDGNGILDHNLL